MNKNIFYRVTEKNDMDETISCFTSNKFSEALADVLLKSRYSFSLSEEMRTSPETSVMTKSNFFDIKKRSVPGVNMTCNIKHEAYGRPFSVVKLETVKGDISTECGFTSGTAYFYQSQDYRQTLNYAQLLIERISNLNIHAAITLMLFAIRDTKHSLWSTIPSLSEE